MPFLVGVVAALSGWIELQIEPAIDFKNVRDAGLVMSYTSTAASVIARACDRFPGDDKCSTGNSSASTVYRFDSMCLPAFDSMVILRRQPLTSLDEARLEGSGKMPVQNCPQKRDKLK